MLRILAVFLSLFLAACGGATRQPSGLMDTPAHHAALGTAFLDGGECAKARREFDLALELVPDHAPALAGKAAALACLKQPDQGLEVLDRAQAAATTDPERLAVAVARLRVLAALARSGRLARPDLAKQVKSALSRGAALDDRHAPLYFHAGEAYIQALDFAAAQTQYARALELGDGFAQRARERLDLIGKVRRGAPGSGVGQEIALVAALTRADMAALLVQELGAAKLYARTARPPDAGFAPPRERPQLRYEESGPPDAAGHPLRADIELVIELGVKGLERLPDGTFRPDEALTRAEAAMIWEDIVVRATGETGLATRYVGGASPFADLGSDHPAFNAAMLATTRGIMETDARSGRFDPLGPVPGADALLSIRQLKDELNVF